MSLITIIGRGHSGTRAISHTLSRSGVYMGEKNNESGDLIPPEKMYEACRIFGRQVKWKGGLHWDWSQLHTSLIDPEFERLIRSYLESVLENDAEHRGWKIPETTLVFPWIRRMFPEIRYIFWIRHPVDSILGGHLTDDLRDFGVDRPDSADEMELRAVSWKYQYDLVRSTPKPKHWIEVRFEDFVLDQDKTLRRLEEFLGFELEKVPVDSAPVGRWKRTDDPPFFDFFIPAMETYGYELPRKACIRSSVLSSR